MAAHTASLPAELTGLLDSIDLSQVQSKQGWVLVTMRKDGPALVRMLWRMLGREQDVMDAYQECFCKLIARGERNEAPPCRGYVFRTAMNAALDMGRRRKMRQMHLQSLEPTALDQVSSSESTAESAAGLIEELRSAIEALPERLREVIVLRDLAELSYRNVARILGLTSGTARVYRRKAIMALSDRMGANADADCRSAKWGK